MSDLSNLYAEYEISDEISYLKEIILYPYNANADIKDRAASEYVALIARIAELEAQLKAVQS